MPEQHLPSFTEHAVVVGLDVNGLGVVRALGEAHVPMVALDTDLEKPTAMTRFAEKIAVETLSGPGFIDALLHLRARFSGQPVLLLTQEASVATVSETRARLEGAYRVTLPPHALMQDLLDKLRFQSIAERHGLPIPRAVRLSGADGAAAMDGLRFPCVLKPAARHAEYGRRFAKAYKVASSAEAARLWAQMRAVIDEAIVQEWIEGGDEDVYFCLQYRPRSGKPVSFAGRKIRQWPMLVGGTAICIPASEAAAELTDLTNRFFGAVGFVGLCSMEYKRDARDGRFYMVEPTVGRTDHQEEIASLNGTNIPLAAYCDALGLALPMSGSPLRPRAWRDSVGAAKARLAGAPDPMNGLASGIEVCDAYFRFDDPMPYLAWKLQPARRRLTALRRALA